MANAEGAGAVTCPLWNEAVLQRLDETKPDLVLTSAQTRIQFLGPDGEASAQAASDGYAEQWRTVEEMGIPVVVFEDTPRMHSKEIDCAAGADPYSCGRSVEEAQEGQTGILADAVEQVPGTVLVDFNDLLCTDDFCPTVVGHVIAYRDTSSHMTKTFTETLAPFMNERVTAVLAG